MSIRRMAAIAAISLSTVAGAGLATAGSAQAAVPTDRCYQFTVDEYTDYIPLVPWEQNIESAAKAANVSLRWGKTTGLACAPSSYTVYSMLSKQHVHDVVLTSMRGTADGTFVRTYYVDPNIRWIDDPHRAPIKQAQEAGLQISFTKSGNYETMTLVGSPVAVLETFGKDFRQVA